MPESYKHAFARRTLTDWLRSKVEESDNRYNLNWSGISLATNRPDPGPGLSSSSYGIFQEYPVCRRPSSDKSPFRFTGAAPFPWDIIGWEGELGIPYTGRAPTYEECLRLGTPPEVIFDIGVLHREELRVAFEVVHRNPVSPEKLQKIREIAADVHDDLWVVTVDADWILNQTKRPDLLRYEVLHGPARDRQLWAAK